MIFGLTSEVPIDFYGVIFRTLDAPSDNDVVNHNVDRFTIKLCDIGVLFDKLATVITGCKTFVNFRYLIFSVSYDFLIL